MTSLKHYFRNRLLSYIYYPLCKIRIDNKAKVTRNTIKTVKYIIRTALVYFNITTYSAIEIAFVSNKEIRNMNNQFRNNDSVTDVLSFPFLETSDLIRLPNKIKRPLFFGCIAICVPQALKQAEQFGHSPAREFAFLAIHGFLHLLGFDHENINDEKQMRSIQRKILSLAGYELRCKCEYGNIHPKAL